MLVFAGNGHALDKVEAERESFHHTAAFFQAARSS